MPEQSNLRQQLGPLSVGNVVSAGLRLYRDHFKVYYSLAFQAYFWLLIPIYGWAKFAAIQGLIARLAFSEITERPETLQEARRHVKPRLWNFFLAGLLVALIFSLAYLAVIVVAALIFLPLGTLSRQNPSLIPIIILLGIIFFLFVIFSLIWLYSRLSIVELPIAIESQSDPSSAISRSWMLTKGFVVRLQLIFFVAYLLTIPISILVQILSSIVQLTLTALLPQDSPIFILFNLLFSVLIGFGSGALLIPFWQAIKAVIYYDLRSRKEGLDLELADTGNWQV
jgi:hypothetical protein